MTIRTLLISTALTLGLLLVVLSVSASSPPFPSIEEPPGPLGKTHWWRWSTFKGVDYWNNPPTVVDIKEHEDGTYSTLGPPPVSVAVVLHPSWGEDTGEPWREAIAWIREAEDIFNNSGVPIRFIIEHIEVVEDLPDSKESAYYHVSGSDYAKYGADLLIILLPHYSIDRLCGIASVGRSNYYGGVLKSASGCSPFTLAHELGHNFGLQHDFKEADEANRGYCIKGSSGSADTCSRGTIMAYARSRVPFFSSLYEYEKEPLGDETHNARDYLNKVKTGRALAWELDQRRDIISPEEPEVTQCTITPEEGHNGR